MAISQVDPTDVVAGLPMYLELTKGNIIRLIELLPGDPDDEVEIRLHIHELQYAPSYEAISYVWGSSVRSNRIECNGKDFHVTASLDAAFRRIRLYDRSRIVWADAICINQGNLKECSHHVAFMDKVYRHAATVLVHMGSASDEDVRNIKALIKDHLTRVSGFDSLKAMPVVLSTDPILADPRWTAIATLFQNTWFGRAWVLQEVGVAKNPMVLYGNATFSYRDLMRLARWIVRCAPDLQQRWGVYLLTVHTDWVDWSEGWKASVEYDYSVVDFLSAAKGLDCSKAHDHVYAFIGHHLLRNEDNSGPIIKPDYEKDALQVYQEFTTLILPKAGVKLLSAVEHTELTIEERTPSWVVRWDMDVIWNSMGYYYPFYYRASGPETAIHPTTIEGRCFITDSLFVDVVQTTFPFSANGEDWPQGMIEALTKTDTLRRVLKILTGSVIHAEGIPEHPVSKHRYANDYSEAVALTLGAGLRNYERAGADLQAYMANYRAFVKVLNSVDSEHHVPASDEDTEKASRFYFDTNLSSKGRSFFVTEKGYFGLGPHILRQGDVCHVLRGARVPFTLRAADDETYKLVGEAYVHGIMNGELVVNSEAETAWNSIVLI